MPRPAAPTQRMQHHRAPVLSPQPLLLLRQLLRPPFLSKEWHQAQYPRGASSLPTSCSSFKRDRLEGLRHNFLLFFPPYKSNLHTSLYTKLSPASSALLAGKVCWYTQKPTTSNNRATSRHSDKKQRSLLPSLLLWFHIRFPHMSQPPLSGLFAPAVLGTAFHPCEAKDLIYEQ